VPTCCMPISQNFLCSILLLSLDGPTFQNLNMFRYQQSLNLSWVSTNDLKFKLLTVTTDGLFYYLLSDISAKLHEKDASFDIHFSVKKYDNCMQFNEIYLCIIKVHKSECVFLIKAEYRVLLTTIKKESASRAVDALIIIIICFL
jgi:hypothetical protein